MHEKSFHFVEVQRNMKSKKYLENCKRLKEYSYGLGAEIGSYAIKINESKTRTWMLLVYFKSEGIV